MGSEKEDGGIWLLGSQMKKCFKEYGIGWSVSTLFKSIGFSKMVILEPLTKQEKKISKDQPPVYGLTCRSIWTAQIGIHELLNVYKAHEFRR